MKTWIKLYTEVLDDPKMGRLSWAERGIWMSLLALAGKLEIRDQEGGESGELGTLADIAWYLRCSGEELQEAFRKFSALGMLHQNGERWFVTNWAKRQARAPSETPERIRERVQKYRSNRKKPQNDAGCNGQGNELNSDSCNALQKTCNDNVTVLETETETETETEKVVGGGDHARAQNLARFLRGLGYSMENAASLGALAAKNGWEERDIEAWWRHIHAHNSRYKRRGRIENPLGYLRAKIEENDRVSEYRMAELFGFVNASQEMGYQTLIEKLAPASRNEDEEIWQRVVTALRTQLTTSAWNVVRAARGERQQDRWIIHCSTPLAMDWLKHRGANLLAQVLAEETGKEVHLEFVCGE